MGLVLLIERGVIVLLYTQQFHMRFWQPLGNFIRTSGLFGHGFFFSKSRTLLITNVPI